jgi:hypothetical protein
MADKKVINFDQEGVAVTVPQQDRRIKAVKLPLGQLSKMVGKPGGFQPDRLVINIALEDEDQPGVYLEEIDPPFELSVRYTRGDLEKAQKAGKDLKLAFWDGTQWVVFTPEKHYFELLPSSQGDGGGHGVVRISRWGDPNTAWGK